MMMLNGFILYKRDNEASSGTTALAAELQLW